MTNAIEQAARILRDKRTYVVDQEAYTTLKHAEEYLWKQAEKSAMTLASAKQIVKDAGYRVLDAGCYEDAEHIYCQSVETCGPSTYNHPKFEVQFGKLHGWLAVTGRPPVRLEVRA